MRSYIYGVRVLLRSGQSQSTSSGFVLGFVPGLVSTLRATSSLRHIMYYYCDIPYYYHHYQIGKDCIRLSQVSYLLE